MILFAACVATSDDDILVIKKKSGKKFTISLTHSCFFNLYKFVAAVAFYGWDNVRPSFSP